jgi:hydroxymethylglutaryl-CoA lyase
MQTSTLIEIGTCDGFQMENTLIPTEMKVGIINRLGRSGLKHIQVASFMPAANSPQMSDAQAVCAHIERIEGVIYSGKCFDIQGIEHAYAAGLDSITLDISCSETHSKKYLNKNLEDSRMMLREMILYGQSLGLRVRAGLECVFGCADEGYIPEDLVVEMAAEMAGHDLFLLSLADSAGVANPVQIKRLGSKIQAIMEDLAIETPLVLHLNDTHGLALPNVMAALECGISHFDTAFGGIGDSVLSTEDAAYFMAQIGVATNVKIHDIADISRQTEAFLGKQFKGKFHQWTASK